MLKFKSFDDAFMGLLTKLYHSPEFYNTPRGRANRECLNISFSINDPKNRICYNPARNTNIIFNFAEVLWYLSGSKSLDFIEYYCKNMRQYSPDNQTLTGCAYGPKMFSYGKEGLDQWSRLIKILKEDDPSSNRALIQIFDPRESLYRSNVDVTCTIALQFFLREEKLYMSTFMRSNDCFRGIVSDIFSFTFIQELIAAKLNVELGSYFHNVGSLHLYETDCKRVEKILETGAITPLTYSSNSLKIPYGDNWDHINILLEYEEKLRKNEISLDSSIIANAKLPEFWNQILILLGIYREIYYEHQINPYLLEKLDLGYCQLIENKWGAKLNTGVL